MKRIAFILVFSVSSHICFAETLSLELFGYELGTSFQSVISLLQNNDYTIKKNNHGYIMIISQEGEYHDDILYIDFQLMFYNESLYTIIMDNQNSDYFEQILNSEMVPEIREIEDKIFYDWFFENYLLRVTFNKKFDNYMYTIVNLNIDNPDYENFY